jgi:hypothetical protein
VRAQAAFDSALERAGDSYYQAGPLVFDADVSRAATVVWNISTEGGNDEVWLVDVEEAIVEVLPTGDARGVAFTRDHLLIATADGSLEIRDESGHDVAAVVPGSPGDAVALIASGEAELAARLRRNGTIVLVDTAAGAVLGTVGSPAPVTYGLRPGIAFSPDGHHMFVASPDISDPTASGSLRHYMTAPEDWVQVACRTAGRDLTVGEWVRLVDQPPPADLRCGRPR